VICFRQDFHLSGTLIASSGLDNSVKIWDLLHPPLQESLRRISSSAYFPEYEGISYNPFANSANAATKTRASAAWAGTSLATGPVDVHFPLFTNQKLHKNYVDCVRWHGDLLLSKTTHNEILMWHPSGVLEPGKENAPRKVNIFLPFFRSHLLDI
jgi:polycomb protein EED